MEYLICQGSISDIMLISFAHSNDIPHLKSPDKISKIKCLYLL